LFSFLLTGIFARITRHENLSKRLIQIKHEVAGRTFSLGIRLAHRGDPGGHDCID
jgi:hypothetical protein